MMKVVVVDDEPGACEALYALMERHTPQARLVGKAHSALEGIKLIQREKPDLVLLDIEMPHGSGFDLLEAFPERTFQVIYTTAHAEHAVRAAHTHPFDYLLKPVDPDDLVRAFAQLDASRPKNAPKRIEIAHMGGKTYIDVADILRIEADGGYSTIHTVQGDKHVASKNIGHFEELLPKEEFMRCHSSHLIALDKVKAQEARDGGMAVMTDGSLVPVASRKHSAFHDAMTRTLHSSR